MKREPINNIESRIKRVEHLTKFHYKHGAWKKYIQGENILAKLYQKKRKEQNHE